MTEDISEGARGHRRKGLEVDEHARFATKGVEQTTRQQLGSEATVGARVGWTTTGVEPTRAESTATHNHKITTLTHIGRRTHAM